MAQNDFISHKYFISHNCNFKSHKYNHISQMWALTVMNTKNYISWKCDFISHNCKFIWDYLSQINDLS